MGGTSFLQPVKKEGATKPLDAPPPVDEGL